MKKTTALIQKLLSLGALMVAATAANAAYPDHPVKIIVSTEAGGAVDVPIRALIPSVAKALGQPMVVENRPGAGSLIGVQAVKNSAADGYTLLATGTGSLTISPILRPAGFALQDFVNIGIVSTSELLLVAGRHTPFKTIQELIAYARLNPKKVNFASNGLGSSTHLVGTLIQRKTGTAFTHVPYKGNPASITALLSKESDVMLASGSVLLPFIESGQLRALATTGATRSSAFPGVPTLRESGVDLTYDTKIALFAPAGVPKVITEKLRRAVYSGGQDEHFQSGMKAAHLTPLSLSPQESSSAIREESEFWREVFSDSGFRKAVETE